MEFFVTKRRSLLALAASVLAILLLVPVARAEPPKAEPFSQDAFDAALASGGPVLVEITADWCPTCRAQNEVFASLLQDPRYADLKILEVDFDNQKDVVRALGAQKQSTLIVYARGEEVGRGVGTTKPKRIASLLDMAY
jgi:thioredoxin 1